MIPKNLRLNRLRAKISERELAKAAGVSRQTLRQIETGQGNPTLSSLQKIASQIGSRVEILVVPNTVFHSDSSSVAISEKVVQGGFNSWKIHFMDFVDEFRRTQDPRLALLEPVSTLEPKLRALFSSITLYLHQEKNLTPPNWCLTPQFQVEPWFLSGMENLKAMAILESPLAFRRNNIFVTENFLKRV